MLKNNEQLKIAPTLELSQADVVAGFKASGAETFAVFTAFDLSGDAPQQHEASRFAESQKQAFLAGEIRNPVLNNRPNFALMRSYRRDIYQAATSLMHVQNLRYEQGIEPNQEDRMLDAMIASIVDQIGYVETAAFVAEGNHDRDQRLAAVELLKRAGREIYRMPETEPTLQLLQAKRATAANIAAEADHPARADAQFVLDNLYLPDGEPTGDTFPLLDADGVEYYQNLLREEFGAEMDEVLSVSGDKEIYTPTEMVHLMQAYIVRRGYDQSGWRAQLVPNRTACATSRKNTAVEVGDKRPERLRDQESVVNSAVHEVEVHIGRSHRWSGADTELAGMILPSASQFEEAFAGTVQNLYFGRHKRQGIPYTVALGLAAGYDRTERDFRDTHELAWRLAAIDNYQSDTDYAEQQTKSQKSAYGTLDRIWRGMPTDVPGCVYPKDAQYDNAEVDAYLANGGRPLPREDFLRLLDAKFTPFDAGQDEFVRRVVASRAAGRLVASSCATLATHED